MITIGHVVNPFHATVLFWYPLKTSENQRFSDAFRGYQKRPLAWNGLMLFKTKKQKKTLWPLFMGGVQLPQGLSHFKEGNFPEIPSIYSLYQPQTMKGWVKLRATWWFRTWDPWIGNRHVAHLAQLNFYQNQAIICVYYLFCKRKQDQWLLHWGMTGQAQELKS